MKAPPTDTAPVALAEQVRAHEAQLYGLALRLTRRPADARDLVQDTFERALRLPPRETANVPAWLATILHHLFIDRVRRSARLPTEAPEALEHLPAPEPATPPRWAQVSDEQLDAAIQQLPAKFREVFVLHLRGRSYDEIAGQLRLPKATVGTRLVRARAKLRDVLVKVSSEERR